MAAPTSIRCHTGALIENLPAPVQIVLNDVLANKLVPTGKILAVLEQHGLTGRAENVNRHRRRLQGGNYACKCPLDDEKATE